MFGRFSDITENDIPLILDAAKKKLSYNKESQTLEQAFIQYFKENSASLSLAVVGMSYHSWSPYSEILDGVFSNLQAEDFLFQAEKVRKAKHDFYSSIEIALQAEPYNHVDENAIAVMAEEIDSKIAGNPGLVKMCYIRATAAKVLKTAKSEKLSYKAKLFRIDSRDVVLKIEV